MDRDMRELRFEMSALREVVGTATARMEAVRAEFLDAKQELDWLRSDVELLKHDTEKLKQPQASMEERIISIERRFRGGRSAR